MVLLAVAIFVLGLWPSFEEFRTLSVYEDAGVRENTRANLAQLGLSVEFYAAYWLTLGAIFAVVCFAPAALIFWRKPEEPMALFVAVMLALLGVSYSGSAQAIDALNPVLGWAGSVVEELMTLFIFLSFFLFPDGRFVPHWTRYVAAVLVVLTIPSALFPDSPFGSDNWSGSFFMLYISGWFFVGVFAQIYRYRRVSSPIERQQTKWVVFGLTVAVAGYLGIFMLGVFFSALEALEPGTIADLLVFALGPHLFFLFIPLSITMAILRYHLWHIDFIINRTLVYGPLTAMLVLCYFGGVVSLQGAFRSLTGQESTLAVVASTLAIAALFNPLRRRVQGFVDRRFYRRKYDAAKILAAFNARLRDETDLGILREDLTGVVKETMQPSHVSLWLRTDPGTQRAQAD